RAGGHQMRARAVSASVGGRNRWDRRRQCFPLALRWPHVPGQTTEPLPGPPPCGRPSHSREPDRDGSRSNCLRPTLPYANVTCRPYFPTEGADPTPAQIPGLAARLPHRYGLGSVRADVQMRGGQLVEVDLLVGRIAGEPYPDSAVAVLADLDRVARLDAG